MESVSVYYNDMVDAIQKYNPTVDMNRINAAYEYAAEKHKDQKRKDGSPYIIHPLAVAAIVAEIGLDCDAMMAALLHDCIEDTDASFEDISRRFGRTVAELVEGVTKLTRVQYSSMEEEQMENLRKMFMAMSKDIRVILIKIADRLHNTRTLEFQTPAKQKSKSLETMEIYAPLAHRLGMQKIKWELEDTSLKYLDPIGYDQIMQSLSEKEEEAKTFMASIQQIISDRLDEAGIKHTIYGRIKHIYSIYRKMFEQKKALTEVYDLYAFRVIVDDIADCYNVLGHVHDLFNPVPGRFKDYISTPKPNMYQSLHTTVIGKLGIPFEVQIRTWEMHQTAEYGIAAHWKYKQNGVGNGEEQSFEWVRRLLENQQDTEAEDFIHSFKVDMFDDEVFVFTPKGQVISLPSGSTPIDFAYAIHSEVGNHMVGAKINSRIVNYDTTLANGDIVEIITSKSAKGPSRDWLKLCKSNQARNKIKQWYKRERREENIQRGKQSFESELKHLGISPSILQNDELLSVVLNKVAFDSLDDMYAAIGYGGLTALKAVNRVREELIRANRAVPKESAVKVQSKPVPQKKSRHSDSGIIVEDLDNCMIKFSRCCTPVPGDDIVGFITRGYGVSIHRRDCPNAAGAASPEDSGRWVKVAWAEDGLADHFSTTLEIDSADRDGLFLDIATILSGMKLKVSELSARSLPGGKSVTVATFEVKNSTELNTVRQKLLNVQGVTAIRRGHN